MVVVRVLVLLRVSTAERVRHEGRLGVEVHVAEGERACGAQPVGQIAQGRAEGAGRTRSFHTSPQTRTRLAR